MDSFPINCCSRFLRDHDFQENCSAVVGIGCPRRMAAPVRISVFQEKNEAAVEKSRCAGTAGAQ